MEMIYMKKFTVLMSLAALSFALTACGGNKAENVETEAASTEAAAETETEVSEAEADAEPVELPEDYESEFFEGIITEVNGTQLTLQDDAGATMRFDISNAELPEDPILTGCDAEVEYAAVDGAEANPAVSVIVLMDIEQQAAIENRDPVIYGTLQLADTNELSILDDSGTARDFDNQMSRTVSFDEIKTGDRVAVTYIGELFGGEDEGEEEVQASEDIFSTPYALKIVAIDALESDEAKANYITGSVDMIYEDGIITLMTNAVTFEVNVDPSMLEGIEEGDNVKVYYNGALSGITVDAASIEKTDN